MKLPITVVLEGKPDEIYECSLGQTVSDALTEIRQEFELLDGVIESTAGIVLQPTAVLDGSHKELKFIYRTPILGKIFLIYFFIVFHIC